MFKQGFRDKNSVSSLFAFKFWKFFVRFYSAKPVSGLKRDAKTVFSKADMNTFINQSEICALFYSKLV